MITCIVLNETRRLLAGRDYVVSTLMSCSLVIKHVLRLQQDESNYWGKFSRPVADKQNLRFVFECGRSLQAHSLRCFADPRLRAEARERACNHPSLH